MPSPPPGTQESYGTVLTGRLVVQASGAMVPLPPGKTELKIGRLDAASNAFPDIDLAPVGGTPDAGVSRIHARLFLQGGLAYIEDLGSTNYTFVNKQKLQARQPYPLANGAELRFGRLVVTYYSS